MRVDTAELELDLEFQKIHDNKIMDVRVIHNDKVFSVSPVESRARICVPITLPGYVELVFSGKDQGHDTIVDEQGNILEDLAVKITRISFGGFSLPDLILPKLFVLQTQSGDRITTSYIGFNGKIQIDLTSHDVFGQVMQWRRLS